MRSVRQNRVLDQAVAILREGIQAGRWVGTLPGVRPLADELHVSSGTIQSALKILTDEGWIAARGAGAARQIVEGHKVNDRPQGKSSLRVGLLLSAVMASDTTHEQAYVRQSLQALEAAGHVPFIAPKAMATLRHDLKAIRTMLGENPADAWIVIAGSYELLEWASQQTTPFFAVGGRSMSFPIAGTGFLSIRAITDCVQQLTKLGHRRIVLVSPAYFRKPEPGRVAQAFFKTLAAAGIAPGNYHLPEWEETPEGLQELLRSLFQLTPPTALIVGDVRQALAVIAFLAARGLTVPRDLSLIVMAPDPALEWIWPKIAYFDKEPALLVRSVVRWVNLCASGHQERRAKFYHSEFVPCDSLAPPPK